MPRLLPRQDDRPATGSIVDGGVHASPALLAQLGLQIGAPVTLRAAISNGRPSSPETCPPPDRTTCCWSPTSPGCRSTSGQPTRSARRASAWRRIPIRRLAGSARTAPAGRPAAASGRRRPRARLEPVTRLPRQPQRPGAGRPADRRLPRLRHATDRSRAALDAVCAARRARPVTAHAPAADIARRAGDRSSRRAARAGSRLRLALGFTQLLGGDLGGGYFSASAPLIVPQLAPALGFLALGCIASLAGALYPAYLNRMQPLAQALKTGFAQSPRASRQRTKQTAAADAARPGRVWTDPPATAVRPAPCRLCRNCPGTGDRHCEPRLC
jgi:hypothetical protein